MADPALARFRADFELVPERSTPQDRFDAMSKEEQDATYGEEIAQALREDKITFADLVMRDGGFIKQRPAEDLNL